MENLTKNLQAGIGTGDVKRTKVKGNKLMKSFLLILLLFSITIKSSFRWGRDGGRGREGHGHEEHHDEHHDDRH